MNERDSQTVVAIVVTYNAPNALARCIRALCAQTVVPDRILVVDNSSQPPATVKAHSDDQRVPIQILTQSTNTGPAGGHAAGLTAFVEGGFVWAWVMDDDCIPDSDCLELLLKRSALSESPTLIFPTWIDEASGAVVNFPAWCGFLIPRSIVEAVGLPRSDFFWWAEDTEYLHWRIPQAGFSVQRDPRARVLHSRIRATGTKPPWKVYYEVRNTVYFRLWIQRHRGRRFYRLGRTLIKMLAGILMRRDQRLRRLWLYARAIGDGVLGRLGKRVSVQIAERA